MSILGQPYSHPRLSASETFQPEGSLQLDSGRLLLPPSGYPFPCSCRLAFWCINPGFYHCRVESYYYWLLAALNTSLSRGIIYLLLSVEGPKQVPGLWVPGDWEEWETKVSKLQLLEPKRPPRNYTNCLLHYEMPQRRKLFRSWLSSLTFPEIPNGTE